MYIQHFRVPVHGERSTLGITSFSLFTVSHSTVVFGVDTETPNRDFSSTRCSMHINLHDSTYFIIYCKCIPFCCIIYILGLKINFEINSHAHIQYLVTCGYHHQPTLYYYNGCSYPIIRVSMKMCLCLLLVQLAHSWKTCICKDMPNLLRQTLNMSGTVPVFPFYERDHYKHKTWYISVIRTCKIKWK
jgi:hypothetical protein